MQGRVLIIAGSDSSGGAGVQADIKTVTALGGYAASAITALTAQNTEGVRGIHQVPADFVVQQIEAVLDDIGADCAKTGMLHSADIIDAVVAALDRLAPDLPLVADPVMVATTGARLLRDDALECLRARLLPRATIVTPNPAEAEALSGDRVDDLDAMKRTAEAIRGQGARAVLVTGGDLAGTNVHDVLASEDGVEVFTTPRIDTTSTHGTGCTLASGIATGLAQGLALRQAVMRARAYVHEALRAAPGLGRGRGPLGHGHTVKPFGPAH